MDHSKEGPLKALSEGTLQTKLNEETFSRLQKIMQSYTYFNLAFLLVGCLELFLLLFFFTFLLKSALLAFSLAAVFLTFFSYFILRVYFQAKKNIQLEDLKKSCLANYQRATGYVEGQSQSHLSLASACTKFSHALQSIEMTFFIPAYLKSFESLLKKLAHWWTWHDIHHLRELMLLSGVDEHIKLVKLAPTSIDAHASLANAYIELSYLYKTSEFDLPSFFKDVTTKNFTEKFHFANERALEELKIIKEFSPLDPQIYRQLAERYQILKKSQEEMLAYEELLSLDPEQLDARLRLGLLYLEHGKNALALRIYEQIKAYDYVQAEKLISHYGNYRYND